VSTRLGDDDRSRPDHEQSGGRGGNEHRTSAFASAYGSGRRITAPAGPGWPDAGFGWAEARWDAARAYRVVYNGQVHAMLKAWGPAYMAMRCVKPQ